MKYHLKKYTDLCQTIQDYIYDHTRINRTIYDLNLLYVTIIGCKGCFSFLWDYSGVYWTTKDYTEQSRTIQDNTRVYRTKYDYTGLYCTIQNYKGLNMMMKDYKVQS